jgi:Na+-translocating ferredoxin:NAD+ oxidoreductase RnfD subunit
MTMSGKIRKRICALVCLAAAIGAMAVLWFIGMGGLFLILMATCALAAFGAIGSPRRPRDQSRD